MTLRVALQEIVANSHSPLLPIADYWERVALRHVAEITNGAAFKSAQFNNAGIGMPLIRIRDVGANATKTFYNGDFEQRHVVEDGDLLIGMDGDFRVARWAGPTALLNQRVCRVRVLDGSCFNETFLEHVLQPYLDAVHELTSAVTVKHLSSKTIGDLPIPLPPLPEQRRIVAAIEEHFSRLDAAAASLTAAGYRIDLLESTAVNIAFDDITERVPLGDLAEVRGGIQKQPKRKPTSNPHSFLRVANVKRNRLELDDVHEIELFDGEIDRFRLAEGDLLVVEGNGSQEQIGRSALWTGEIENCVHQNHLIRVRPGATLNPRFLNAFWNSPINSRQLTAVASSTSGLYTLSTSKLNRVLIPVAGSTSQARIADQLDDIRLSIDRLRAQMRVAWQRSAAMRRSVLAAAFSGQLVQQDPSDEPASVLLERIAAYRAAAKPSPRKRVTA